MSVVELSVPVTTIRTRPDSSTWDVARNLALVLGVVFWAATVYWVYKAARRRIEDPWLVGIATLLGAIPPFLGPLIYMLFRPPEYLEDVRERQLEIRAIEESISHTEQCPVCRTAVDGSFLVCPICTTRLRQACRHCRQPLDPAWQLCPYCETPIEQPPPVQPSVQDYWTEPTEIRPRRENE